MSIRARQSSLGVSTVTGIGSSSVIVSGIWRSVSGGVVSASSEPTTVESASSLAEFPLKSTAVAVNCMVLPTIAPAGIWYKTVGCWAGVVPMSVPSAEKVIVETPTSSDTEAESGTVWPGVT